MVAILVVLTIISFVAADFVLQRIRARRVATAPASREALRPAELLLPALQAERFSLPGGIFFHRGHTWANLLFSGQVKVGVDDFLQKLLGKVDGCTLPPVGAEVKEGQPFAVLRQAGRTLTLLAPVDGVVCAVNQELGKAPALLKRDPYTRGWLVAIRPRDLTANLPGLLVGEKALGWLRTELSHVRDFLDETLEAHRDALVGATAADGGLSADGLLERMDDATWTAFESRFLRS